jgi:hypothetical protein
MGILDDAIREHLDLKRQHGVPEEELRRQEEEALGPARRDVAPAESADGEGAAEPELHDEETVLQEPDAALAEEAPAVFDAAADDGPIETEPADTGVVAETEIADVSAPEIAEERPEEQAAGEDRLAEAAEPREDVAADVAEERLGVADAELADDRVAEGREAELADDRFAERGEAEIADDHFAEGREADIADERVAEGREADIADERVADEPLVEEATPAEPLIEEATPAESAGDTLPSGFERVDEDEPHGEDGEPGEGEADVLEDTPDFLQETPEHDRLWFEQKPPRDFDFD